MSQIPANAIEIRFKYGRSFSGKFHVWITKGGRYQWDALGNNGEAPTQEKAIDEAREWILDGYDALQPSLKTLYTSKKSKEMSE